MVIGVLDARLRAAGIPIAGVADNGDSTYRVDFLPSATPQQISDGTAIAGAFDGVAEQAILDQVQDDAAAFEGLPEWAAYTTTEAVDAIHNAILAGDTLAQAQAKIDALPATIAGMKTGLKAAAAEFVTARGLLEKMAKAVVYLRDRTG